MNTKPTTVFVTGGMSGLGRALVSEYVRRGAHVAIFDLIENEAVLLMLERQKADACQRILFYRANVADADVLEAAVADAVAAIGGPCIAINCAGIQRAQPFDVQVREDFELVMRVNTFGTRNFAAAVLPSMVAGSRLVLVASMAGFAANYSYAAYSASKFAVIGLGRVLRLELKPRGIAVSLVCPPEVQTPMVAEEVKTMHPASRRLKDFGGTLGLPEAIHGIMVGLDAGRGVIIPGRKARLTYFLNRYLPDWIMNSVVDTVVRSALREDKAAQDSASGKV